MPSYGVLGTLRAEVEGSRVHLGGRRREQLLAVLLAHRGVGVSLDRLTEALWGPRPPPTATRTLRAHVSALRRALGSEAIRTVTGGYRLPARALLDVDGFLRDLSEARANARANDLDAARHRYTLALGWWRGPAYEDIELQGFELVAERQRLGALRVEAWRERAHLEIRVGRSAEVIEDLRALVAEHPWDEGLGCQLATALYRAGRQVEALRTLAELRSQLGEQMGLEPTATSRELELAILRQDLPHGPTDPLPPKSVGSGFPVEVPDPVPQTRYACNGRTSLAYQVFGQGRTDLLFLWGTPSNVDLIWDEPRAARFLHRLGEVARVISFDKRGVGVSDPTEGDRPPPITTRLDDALTVLGAADSARCALLGFSEGGATAVRFAVEHPERVSSLILCGTFARLMQDENHPFGFTPGEAAAFVQLLREGRNLSIDQYFPGENEDPATVRWFHRFFQNSASPRMMLDAMVMASQVDVRDLLPRIDVPTLVLHRTGDVTVRVEHARHLAETIPGARLVEFPGTSHWPWLGRDASDEVLEAMTEHLLGVAEAAPT